MRRHDCTVRALALALGAPYDEVESRLSIDGYRRGRGFHLPRWLACEMRPAIGEPRPIFGYRATWHPCPARKGEPRMTPATFAAAHPIGRYVLKQVRHAVAVVDGAVVMETRRPDGGCVYGAWRFVAWHEYE